MGVFPTILWCVLSPRHTDMHVSLLLIQKVKSYISSFCVALLLSFQQSVCSSFMRRGNVASFWNVMQSAVQKWPQLVESRLRLVAATGKNTDLRSELGPRLELHHAIIITVETARPVLMHWPCAARCCVCPLCCLCSVFWSARCYVSTPVRPGLSLQPWALMRPDSLFTLDAISLTFLHGLALTASWWLAALLN